MNTTNLNSTDIRAQDSVSIANNSDPSVFLKNPRRPGSAKGRAMILSALVIICLPTLLSIIYYFFVASDQYAATAHFIVRHRSQDSTALSALSILGMGSGSSSSMGDTMILNDYITSLQIIKDLSGRIDLRSIYGTPQADWFARLRAPYGEKMIADEQLLKYWQKMVGVHYDSTTSITSIEVRAFSPLDAKRIADTVFELGEQLVNRLSNRAQQDSLALAKREVEDYRKRAVTALDDLQRFQEKVQQVNPLAFTETQSKIQSLIEGELSQLQSQLDLLRESLPEEAPGIIQAKGRLASLEKQLHQERKKSTLSESGDSAAAVMNEFSKLKLESEFAIQAYQSSLASLESARINAMSQNLYLETSVSPHEPQIAEYPSKYWNILFVFIISFLVWAIGGLFISAIREHI